MKLKLKPHSINTFPIGGVLIKGTSPRNWFLEIQRMELPFSDGEIYPIPGLKANSVWGCFVPFSGKNMNWQKGRVDRNELVQQVTENLFIVEKSILFPQLRIEEIQKLFPENLYVLHPEFGFAVLSEPINIGQLLIEPEYKEILVRSPEKSYFFPSRIKSFQVISMSPDEVMEDMEKNFFIEKKEMKEDPLSPFEKGKLAFYKALLSEKSDRKGTGSIGGPGGLAGGLLSSIGGMLGSAIPGMGKMTDQMLRDFEALERRNQKKLDKLLDMLKKNPDEALKYAIPLDHQGTNRGGVGGELGWLQRWNDFSLFGGNKSRNSSGGSINFGERYFELMAQYRATAQQLESSGDYRKAAFVYMKLLQDYSSAATALENGKLYKEAAAVYLKKLQNKQKAAECFEKGNMISEAIALYKELEKFEKVGDLYVGLNKQKEANPFYQIVANQYINRDQYLKASLIYRNKMKDKMKGQDLLLRGWAEHKDAFNCLNNYFTNVDDPNVFKKELENVFQNYLEPRNRETFLRVLAYEFEKRAKHKPLIREMAYEVVQAQIPNNRRVVDFLRYFNKKDKQLVKDTIRFKVNRR